MNQSLMQQQVEELATLSEDELLRKLGMQMQQAEQVKDDPEALEEARAAGAFEEPAEVEMGLGENLRAFGARWWSNIEPKLYELLCRGDNPDRDKILELLPQSEGSSIDSDMDHEVSAQKIAGPLAIALIGLLPFQIPMIASVAATIAAKMLIASGLRTTCDLWQESMEERANEAADEEAAPPEGDA